MMLQLVLLFLFSSGGDWINAYKIGDCGIRDNKVVPASSHGESSMKNGFPWHVALYKMDSTNKYECGGSIIDTNIVLTAAHCLFDEPRMVLDNSTMVVAAGKYNSSWEHRDVHEQRFEVIRKVVAPFYMGLRNRYQDDIALLALNDTIKFSSAVMPVCLDHSGMFQPSEKKGMVVGWAFNGNNVSEELHVYQMQPISRSECIDDVGEGFEVYLTLDKFCAIYKDGSTVRQGEGGGGLVFTRNLDGNETSPRYFIKGILSIKERGNKNTATFTNINDFIPWLKSTLMTIST